MPANLSKSVSGSYVHVRARPVNADGTEFTADLSNLNTVNVDIIILNTDTSKTAALPTNFGALIGVSLISKSGGAVDPGFVEAGLNLTSGVTTLEARIAVAPGAGENATVRLVCILTQ